jgi:hypothetical protein
MRPLFVNGGNGTQELPDSAHEKMVHWAVKWTQRCERWDPSGAVGTHASTHVLNQSIILSHSRRPVSFLFTHVRTVRN